MVEMQTRKRMNKIERQWEGVREEERNNTLSRGSRNKTCQS